MTDERDFEFVIVETATYRISAKAKTVEEAARAVGAQFGADPLRFCDSVDERTVIATDAQATDVDTEFDAGMADFDNEPNLREKRERA